MYNSAPKDFDFVNVTILMMNFISPQRNCSVRKKHLYPILKKR